MVSAKNISLVVCSALLLHSVRSFEISHSLVNRLKKHPNNLILNESQVFNKKLKRRWEKGKHNKKWDKDEEDDDEDDDDEDEEDDDEEDEDQDDEEEYYKEKKHKHHWHDHKHPNYCSVEESEKEILPHEMTLTFHPEFGSTTTTTITPTGRATLLPLDGTGGLEFLEGGRVPECYGNDITETQLAYLKHFNGIFGAFIATAGSIEGPIAAKNITTTDFSFNTLGTSESYCQAAVEINRYGIVADYVGIDDSVNGAIAANSGSIDSVIHPSDCTYDIGGTNDLWDNINDMFSGVIPGTSTILRNLVVNYAFLEDTEITVSTTESFNVFKLAPCSDDLCHNPTEEESVNNILKGGDDWNGPLDSLYDSDFPTVINVPVFVNRNYTITSKNVNAGGLEACSTTFHFYPVDENGDYVDGTFGLIRGDDVEINGLIFAPQANIYDSSTGSFGGQVVTLQTYYSGGATIRNYSSVESTCNVGKAACWPLTKLEIMDFPYEYITITLSSSVFDGTTTYSTVKTEIVDIYTNSIVDYETIETTSYLVDTTRTTSTVEVTDTQASVMTVMDQFERVKVLANVEYVTMPTTITYTQTTTKTRYTSTSTMTDVDNTKGTTEVTHTKTSTSTEPYAPAQMETAFAVASMMFNND